MLPIIWLLLCQTLNTVTRGILLNTFLIYWLNRSFYNRTFLNVILSQREPQNINYGRIAILAESLFIFYPCYDSNKMYRAYRV